MRRCQLTFIPLWMSDSAPPSLLSFPFPAAHSSPSVLTLPCSSPQPVITVSAGGRQNPQLTGRYVLAPPALSLIQKDQRLSSRGPFITMTPSVSSRMSGCQAEPERMWYLSLWRRLNLSTRLATIAAYSFSVCSQEWVNNDVDCTSSNKYPPLFSHLKTISSFIPTLQDTKLFWSHRRANTGRLEKHFGTIVTESLAQHILLIANSTMFVLKQLLELTLFFCQQNFS